MAHSASAVAPSAVVAAGVAGTSLMWAEFAGRLRAFVARRVPPGIEPDDVVQEVFVRVPAMKSRVQRARDQLKQMLLRCCEVDVDRRRRVADYHLRESATCGAPSDGSGGCGLSRCSSRQ